MLHEALKRAGHVVPASEIIIRTRRPPRPMRPVVYAIVLGAVSLVSAGGALVLYHQEPSYAEPTAGAPRAMAADATTDSPPPTPVSQPISSAIPTPADAPPAEAITFGAPTPVAIAPAEPSPEVRLLLARGDSLLRTGDFTAARLFYQRAAEQGHGAGALGVAKTYDPVFLAEAGYRTARPPRGSNACAAPRRRNDA